MILLFVVIYIYSYVAFRLMRDSFLNIDSMEDDDDESPD